ncbi:hypothetical protein Kpho01_65140 [Kitasatospora phosalacinea]|uniref:Uncharacterized protein n=1 Tax=Kitasatospora phosalacinea TaxID=2065 RepID=A0A9W6PPF1_9ACTN|nr:hypothetical protein Kpho01_65140 [Kitasatospora phosalacinea]
MGWNGLPVKVDPGGAPDPVHTTVGAGPGSKTVLPASPACHSAPVRTTIERADGLR